VKSEDHEKLVKAHGKAQKNIDVLERELELRTREYKKLSGQSSVLFAAWPCCSASSLLGPG
jgi:hypothetical protein